MRALIAVVLAVFRDVVRVWFRTRAELIAENLFLRRQLAIYQERKARRRRPTPNGEAPHPLVQRVTGRSDRALLDNRPIPPFAATEPHISGRYPLRLACSYTAVQSAAA